jgi:DNA-binding SARP family transcriptional activator/tetratricopeptide (TPR) repeat protein
MQYGILGPVEVWDGERRLAVGGPQQRALLAALLLDANRVVSTDRLVAVLWGDDPPSTARSLLQGCVAALRRTLNRSDRPLVTRSPGYSLEVAPGELDLARFDQLVTTAADADHGRAAELLREALSLWRGPALDGVTVDGLRSDVIALEERRLAAHENRIDIDLRLGHHASLVGELSALVRTHPLRERLRAQLMLALHRAGRPAEALAAYRDLRAALVEKLGVEPGATVQQLHRTILADGDPKPAGTPVAAAEPLPAQLPAATAMFTGRAGTLKRLDELLTHDSDRLAIGVVTGTAGVGKTALAVHWGHRTRARFPDGQLFVDLRGYASAPPLRPAEVLAGFLSTLGVPADQIPVELEPAAAMYRTRLADKRVLVLLDNAGAAEQVRPLLPGAGGSLVLVTSRDQLAGLVARDGAVHIGLDVLDAAEAQELLGRTLGPERVDAEPAASAELARLCGHLPLALQITAANLIVRPHRRLADQVSELAGDDRLAALTVDDDQQATVRAAFDLSYSVLEPGERRMFRLLGLLPGPDVTAAAAAVLTGTSPELAGRLLARLAGAHLLGEPAPGRYTFHDLLRQYAAEQAHREDGDAERAAAVGELLGWYLRGADAAAKVMSPEKLRLPLPPAAAGPAPTLDSHGAALAWLDAERPNLLAVIRHASEHGPRPVAWLLADALRGYFGRRMLTIDWLSATGHGLAAAEAAGDLPGQAATQLSIADAYNRRSEYERATAHYDRALELFRRSRWPEGEASVLCNSGGVYLELGELEQAAERTSRALVLNRRAGMVAAAAVCLGNLACVYAGLGQLAEAADHASQAMAAYRTIGSVWGEATSLGYLGDVRRNQGRLAEALDLLGRALALHRDAGNRGGESDVLRAIAATHCEAGRVAEAMAAAQAALVLAQETADPRIEADVLTVLGAIHTRRSEPQTAADHCERALELSRRGRMRQEEAAALAGLAAASSRLGRREAARSYAREALGIARAGSFRLTEAKALAVLGEIDGSSVRSPARRRSSTR